MKLQELGFGCKIETMRRSRGEVTRAIRVVVGGEVTHIDSPICYNPWEVKDEQRRVWKVVADSSLTSSAQLFGPK